MALRYSLLIFIIVISFGCYSVASKFYNPDKKVELYKSSPSNSDYLVIYKMIHGNCGCATVYAEKFLRGRVVYSISYACPTGLPPYLQIKQYDSLNNLVTKVCYRATENEIYDRPVSEDGRIIIRLIDSLSKVDTEKDIKYRLCVKTIKGFNKIECAY